MRSSFRNTIVLGAAVWLLFQGSASAGVIFGNSGLSGGARWDAGARTISGNERSLDGGLRYSLQGNSFQAYRDLFTWSSVPTVTEFQSAVQSAFAAWAAPDPVSKFASGLSFVADLSTTPVGRIGGGININGGEIDLFGSNDASFWNPGNSGLQGETWFNFVGGTLTLTSGTTGYAAQSIAGADITMNSNPQAVWNLDVFRRVLTHEIGHAIGLGDVEGSINPGVFIDDNFDNLNSTTIVATLNNSWVDKINPLDPSASVGLSLYNVPNSATSTAGVDILMESFGVGISPNNPLSNLVPLTNDDFSTRYFLYPTLSVVPEPSSVLLVTGSLVAAWSMRRRAKKGSGLFSIAM